MRLIGIFSVLAFIFSFYLPADERYLLITGCGRSGTSYISQLLMKSGIDIPHEELGTDGCASWLMCVETDSTPYGPGRKGHQFKHIIHQVRDPLKVISSVYFSFKPASWKYILQHTPEISPTDSKVVKAAKYWYYWNLRAESVSDWTYRIEDIDQLAQKFEDNLGLRIDERLFTDIPKDTNTRNNVQYTFTWQELSWVIDPELCSKMQEMARRYGYTITK